MSQETAYNAQKYAGLFGTTLAFLEILSSSASVDVYSVTLSIQSAQMEHEPTQDASHAHIGLPILLVR